MRSTILPCASITKTHGSEGSRNAPPAAGALGDLVVVVDLHVDEARLVAGLVFDLLVDVHDRSADPALAEQRRGEQQHGRLVAERRRRSRACACRRAGRACRSWRGRRRLPPSSVCGSAAGSRRPPAPCPCLRQHHELGRRRLGGDQPVVQPRHSEHLVAPGLLERHVGHVQRLGRVRVLRGGLAHVRRLHRERLVVRDERALRLAAADRRDVDRRRGVRDLRARAVNSPKPSRFWPVTKSRHRRREHRPGLRAGPVAAPRASCPSRAGNWSGVAVAAPSRVVGVVAAAAADGHERAGEQGGSNGRRRSRGGEG